MAATSILKNTGFALIILCTLATQSCNNEAETPVSDAVDTSKVVTTQPATRPTTPSLDGTWQLDYISGPRIAFDGLYPGKKPELRFTGNKVGGNSGCNSINGTAQIDSSAIGFSDFIMTKMACPGEGESVFLNTIKKVNRFAITGDTTLNLIMGDIAVMRFKRIAK